MKIKKPRLTKNLFVFLVVLFMMFQTSIVHAERYNRSYQQYFVETKPQIPSGFYDPQRKTSAKALPVGAFLCDGKVVMAPDVIKQQLSCTQKNEKSGFIALF